MYRMVRMTKIMVLDRMIEIIGAYLQLHLITTTYNSSQSMTV
jgi:hypothetical protein